MHCNLAMRILMHNANSYLHWSEKILQIVGTKHNRFTYNKKPILLWSSIGQVGHWTDGRIRNDMVNFVRSAMLKDVRSASSTTPRNLDVPTRNAPDC